jgi:hypothetical protein
MTLPNEPTHPVIQIENILVVSADGLEIGQIVGQMPL